MTRKLPDNVEIVKPKKPGGQTQDEGSGPPPTPPSPPPPQPPGPVGP